MAVAFVGEQMCILKELLQLNTSIVDFRLFLDIRVALVNNISQ